MISQRLKKTIAQLLAEAGITVNGPNPWDIHVLNDQFYKKVIRAGSLGFGESYMDGDWTCEAIDQMIVRLLKAKVDQKIYDRLSFWSKLYLYYLRSYLSRVYNFQNKRRVYDVAKKHYDLSNELFSRMLDPDMSYSCGYWKDSETLEDAQRAKLALICGKLQLRPGMRVLDIGCGWGSFAHYAATYFGVSVVGITISEQQYKYAIERCKGLPVEIRLQDYREMNERFDAIASIGMFEHVGEQNYQTYMSVVHRCLSSKGLFLLHTIGGNRSLESADPWISKYIFPNGMIPSVLQIGRAFENLLIMEDWHNFGTDYDRTLMAWFENFNQHWDVLKSDYDDRFYRMWEYYLKCCAGAFRVRDLQVWQIVFSKQGIPGGYRSIR